MQQKWNIHIHIHLIQIIQLHPRHRILSTFPRLHSLPCDLRSVLPTLPCPRLPLHKLIKPNILRLNRQNRRFWCDFVLARKLSFTILLVLLQDLACDSTMPCSRFDLRPQLWPSLSRASSCRSQSHDWVVAVLCRASQGARVDSAGALSTRTV